MGPRRCSPDTPGRRLQRYTRTATDTVRGKILTWADVQEHRYCDQDQLQIMEAAGFAVVRAGCGHGGQHAGTASAGPYYLDAANADAAI